MLRRLGIRAKVLAVLAVPMLVVLIAGAFISWESLRNFQTEQNVRRVVAAASSYVAVNEALNNERTISQTGATPDEIAAARKATDTAFASFLPALDAIDASMYPKVVANSIASVKTGYTQDLPAARSTVDHPPAGAVGAEYATFISNQLALFDHLAQELGNRPVASYLAAYVSTGRTVSSLVEERIEGGALFAQTKPAVDAGQAYGALANQTEVYREAARTAVADLAIPGVQLPFGDPSATFISTRNLLRTGSPSAMAAVQPKSFVDDITAQRQGLTTVAGRVLQTADSTAGGASAAAQQRALVTVGITAMAVLLSFLLALVVSRTIVIPLRRLTAAATDLREELPRLVEQVQVPGEGPQTSAPQIPVTSRDEVGRLAGAFNAVNATTFRVAQEQAALRGSIAEMFVNVARRDQVLLNRQLSFIDSLERTEEDPQALANLFRLDHLATRMRRNAESLLVLAGIDSGRRLRDTLPLSDVVRTASSEIEQYDRVELDLQADPHMLGFNALPAAHLLAELLENATVFSEPETPVTVTTGVSGAFVEVRILDLGLGMSDEELAAANEKIASTAVSSALGAQRLGLFVVGRLAQRLSTEVVLRKNSTGPNGTETVVRFPATLFQSTESSPLGVYGDTAAPASLDAPEVTEFDLAALTDGVTDQGLPRRRSADAEPVGPARGGARSTFDENAIVLPEVHASALPADLSGADPDWSPLRVAGVRGTNLPNRQRSAAEATGAVGVGPAVDPAAPAAPADPTVRAGLFAGFRGRLDRPAAAPEPTDVTPEPAQPEFVVPGLAPDDDVVPADRWSRPETRVPAESAPQPAEEPSPSWASWASQAPSWGEESEGYVPATFAPEAADQAAPLVASSSAAEPAVAPQDGLAAPDEAVVPAGASDGKPSIERWTPPEVDLAQWSVPEQEPPQFGGKPDAFAGLSGWSAPGAEAVAEAAPYAPFERTLDEARAWATGALPVVPAPAGFPGADAPRAAAEPVAPPVTEPAPVAFAEPEPEPVAFAEPEPAPVPAPIAFAEPESVPAPIAFAAPDTDAFAEARAWGQWNPDAEPWSADLAIPQLELDPHASDDVSGLPAATPEVPLPVAAVPAPPADVPVAEEPFDGPVAPAWAPTTAGAGVPVAVGAGFAAPRVDEPPAKQHRGWFGRRKQAVPTVVPTPVAAPVPPAAAVPQLPVRSSAWAPTGDLAVPEPFPTRAPAPAPEPPAPARVPAAQAAPVAPVSGPGSTTWAPQTSWNPPPAASPLPESSARSAPSWAPPEWAPRPAQSASAEPSGSASAEPASAPRIGTLDDEVAAMLALRSDIQEQALSELSQLSAYRPQVVPVSDRLTRRVPTAVPEAPEIVESTAERNPDEVRSRLASFQSGTARGRRDAGQDEERS